MDYQKIMCEFCKECSGSKITETIIRSTSIINGDMLLVRCENYCPKYDFEDKEQCKNKYCSFFDTGGENEETEDRIYGIEQNQTI